MDKNKKIDFKKQVLPIILVIAALIVGVLFKDELTAIFGTEDGGYSGYTYETEFTEEAMNSVAEEMVQSTQASNPADTASAAETSAAPTEEAYFTEESSSGEVEILYYFRSEQQYVQHYEKHGHEFTPIFGEITMEEYLMYANALIQSEDEEILTKTEKEDGDFMYFRPSTEEFLVLSTDGYIRTYFIPTAGIDYWNRQ